MPKLNLTKEAAERIVRAGATRLYDNVQTSAKPARTWKPAPESHKILVKNVSYSDLEIGQPIFLDGMAEQLPYDEQAEEYRNKGICVSGYAYDQYEPDRPMAFAVEPIASDSIGECWIEGIRPAILTGYTTGDHYANLSKQGVYTAVTDGEYWIVAKSLGKEIPQANEAQDGEETEEEPAPTPMKYFAYVIPVPDYYGGHYIGTTNGALSGSSDTTSVDVLESSPVKTLQNVSCPLLRAGDSEAVPPVAAESLEEGTMVVVARNRYTGALEIIEAQCPVEESSSSSDNNGSST